MSMIIPELYDTKFDYKLVLSIANYEVKNSLLTSFKWDKSVVQNVQYIPNSLQTEKQQERIY